MKDFQFNKFPNTCLTYTLLNPRTNKNVFDYREPTETAKPIVNNLGMVSALYLYTNTPPHAYGTQAPKVAETISRAYSFNKKTIRKTIKIFDIAIERLHWEKKDGAFPFGDIHGNYIPSEMKKMVEAFTVKYCTTIDNIACQTIEEMMHENSDILTKGRQTFCPILENSTTAPRAYREFYDFLTDNGAPGTMTCLEWLQQIMGLFEKDTIVYKKKSMEEIKYTKFDKASKQRVNLTKQRWKIKKVQTKDKKETRAVILSILSRFASYMKHKERGKKDRRAIASGNMGIRMFLHVIESFHLELGKHIEGSTISIGGEEKKTKITTNFTSASLKSGRPTHVSQGTEDATKWNECLSPSSFALMHNYMFDEGTRSRLGLPPPSENGKLLQRIMMMGNFLMSMKTVQLGPGVLIRNKDQYRRVNWDDEDIKLCSEGTQKWYNEIKHLITPDRKYLLASPGMLMGMLNAGSTTLGLMASNHNMDPEDMKVITLRSSDDSMTKYLTIGSHWKNRDCITIHKKNLEMIGINLSKDKTFFFKEGFGEYTSWYMDQYFVSQFGVETSAIKPQGKNPPDDFFSVAKGTSIALSTLTINHIGAEARLRLGIDNVRRLWRIKKDFDKREGIKKEVLLLSDGGANIWDVSSCHLQEVAFKETYISTEEERNYFLRCLNPDNPFCEPPDEELTFSKEHGCLQIDEVEVPRTVFHYVKRSNRTNRTKAGEVKAKEEKTYGEALKVIQLVDPTTLLEYPSTNVSLQNHLVSILQTETSNLELTDEEVEEINNAVQYLQTSNAPGDDEQIEMGSDEDDAML